MIAAVLDGRSADRNTFARPGVEDLRTPGDEFQESAARHWLGRQFRMTVIGGAGSSINVFIKKR